MSSNTRSSSFTVAELEKHPHFRRAKHRKSRWYCLVCDKPERAGVLHFDPSGAAAHECSQHHQDNLRRISQPQEDLNAWAGFAPFAWDQVELPERRLWRKHAFDELKAAERAEARIYALDKARGKWRVRMWLKAVVLAAGGTWVATPDDIEPPQPGLWWDTRGEELPPERAWGLAALSDGWEIDPRNTEDCVSEIRPPEGHFVDVDINVGDSYSHSGEQVTSPPTADGALPAAQSTLPAAQSVPPPAKHVFPAAKRGPPPPKRAPPAPKHSPSGPKRVSLSNKRASDPRRRKKASKTPRVLG